MHSEQEKSSKNNSVTASVLDAFDLLKTTKQETKVIGGAKIISLLNGIEKEKEIQYVTKRLVRSLGANTPDARSGYFATFVSLLSNCSEITVPQILDLVKKELHANGSSKSEVGDVALGQILTCGAIFRSDLIFKSTSDEQAQVVQLLLKSSKKKSYLGCIGYQILLDFTIRLDEDKFTIIVWSNIKQELKKDIQEHNLDSLHFLMVVNNRFPQKVKIWKLLGVKEILCEDNIPIMCEKLMTGIDFGSVNHPIYKEVGRQIAKSIHLKQFWTSGIESQLVKHNRNREIVAINILSTILNNLEDNVDVIPELISTNFFKLFMDWFKGLQTASKIRSLRDNEDDSKIMIKKQKDLLNCLAKALKSDKVTNKVRVELLTKLLLNPGEINFTEITGTNIVKTIIRDLDKDSVKKLAKLFKAVLLNTSKKFIKQDFERNWYNNERIKAAELISYLVTHEAVKDDTDFKLIYMKLLMCFGFFKIGGDENIAIGSDLSGSIKTCFYRCFTSRFSNVDDLVTVLSSLCNFICSILTKEEVRIKIEKQFPSENMECWQMVMEVCQNIEKKESKCKVDNVFLILLYQLGLFLFSDPGHVKIAKSAIKELKTCYEHVKKTNKKKNQHFKKEGALSDEEPEWIEVLVEVLLSILSAESSVLRSVVQCVFRLLWEYLTPSTINQIVSVLDPENESNPLSQDSESEDEELEEEDKNEDDGQDDDSGSDSQVEDDEDEDLKTPEQLKLAVQKALGAAAIDSETESVDADMIDEEEGKKLDEALAEAFKQFNQGKNKKTKKDRKDKKALSDFRIRVLDLVDIYLEKDPSLDICLCMIAPLTRCLEFCIQENYAELESRVRKTIKLLTKTKKFASNEDVTINTLSDCLKSVIEKGARSHFLYQALGDVITYLSTFIIICSQKLEPKSVKPSKKIKSMSPLLDVFKEALHNFFQNRSCLLPIIFFHNILQTDWQGSYELMPIVIENIFNENVRQFRRNEGLELMAGFYRNLKRKLPSCKDELVKLTQVEKKFNHALTQSLSKQTEFAIKNNFFVVLKKLLNTMKMFHESCHIDTILNFTTLLDIVGSCKGSVKANYKLCNGTTVNQLQNNKNSKKRILQQNGHNEPQNKKNKVDN